MYAGETLEIETSSSLPIEISKKLLKHASADNGLAINGYLINANLLVLCHMHICKYKIFVVCFNSEYIAHVCQIAFIHAYMYVCIYLFRW